MRSILILPQWDNPSQKQEALIQWSQSLCFIDAWLSTVLTVCSLYYTQFTVSHLTHTCWEPAGLQTVVQLQQGEVHHMSKEDERCGLNTLVEIRQQLVQWPEQEVWGLLTSPRSCSCSCCRCWTLCWAVGSCSSSAQPPCRSLCSFGSVRPSPSYSSPLDAKRKKKKIQCCSQETPSLFFTVI